ELEPRQHLFMADAAARILVHNVNELRNRVLAVTHDVSGSPAGRRDQLAMHYEQPMVIPLEESLYDHRTRMLPCDQESLRNFLIRREPNGDSAAMIAVVGLGPHGKPDTARGAHGGSLGLHELLGRHRQAE